MSGRTKYPREAAWALAMALRDGLKPACERIEIAGSLRRGKAEVGDIELLFIPRIERRRAGLFDVDAELFDLADDLLNTWQRGGILDKRLGKTGLATWGPKNKLAVWHTSGMPVDFFATDAKCWWNALVCRTGGKDNNLLIATTAQKRGWCFKAYGSGFLSLHSEDFHHTTSERDVYEFIGLKYPEPEERD